MADHIVVQNTINEFVLREEHHPPGRYLAQLTPASSKIRINTDDHTGLSFWLLSAVMLAAAVFFFFQVWLVPRQWSNAMVVNGLVCGVAWHHYVEMREVWIDTNTAPTVYRYMDWLVTVPMQVAEFFLILVAATPPGKGTVSTQIFLRLQIAATLMLVFGYMGETGEVDMWLAFACGMFCWLYVVFEVYFGEASRTSNSLSVEDAKKFLEKLRNSSPGDEETDLMNLRALTGEASKAQKAKEAMEQGTFTKPAAQIAFETLRQIFLFGWALYPAGYVIGTMYMNTGDFKLAEDTLNAVYNVADLINKVSFGLAIYYAANSKGERQKALMYDYGFADANALKLKSVMEGNNNKPVVDFKLGGSRDRSRFSSNMQVGAILNQVGNSGNGQPVVQQSVNGKSRANAGGNGSPRVIDINNDGVTGLEGIDYDMNGPMNGMNQMQVSNNSVLQQSQPRAMSPVPAFQNFGAAQDENGLGNFNFMGGSPNGMFGANSQGKGDKVDIVLTGANMGQNNFGAGTKGGQTNITISR